MSGILGTVRLDATVRRTRENYRTICLAKLQELPPTLGDWMNLPNEHFNGRTPQDTIMDGDGHVVEERVEKLVHLHEAFVALSVIFNRFNDVPELEETWQALLRAVPNYQRIVGAA